ncbi:hypothetical protein GP486_005672, partial [Trichoglossum hirsutum]
HLKLIYAVFAQFDLEGVAGELGHHVDYVRLELLRLIKTWRCNFEYSTEPGQNLRGGFQADAATFPEIDLSNLPSTGQVTDTGTANPAAGDFEIDEGEYIHNSEQVLQDLHARQTSYERMLGTESYEDHFWNDN